MTINELTRTDLYKVVSMKQLRSFENFRIYSRKYETLQLKIFKLFSIFEYLENCFKQTNIVYKEYEELSFSANTKYNIQCIRHSKFALLHKIKVFLTIVKKQKCTCKTTSQYF